MNQPPSENRDLVLAPGSYAYVQAENNGAIKTHVGPAVVTLSGQDRPVTYDPATRQFQRVHQDEAVMTNIAAEEGDYVILENPAPDHPEEGGARATPQTGLKMGSRVVIPGPTNFALWPGQSAETVDGHHLSSNEFLIVRVYNEGEAQKNWDAGTVSVKDIIPLTNEGEDSKGSKGSKDSKDKPEKTTVKQESLSLIDPKELKRGQRIIVRGDQVSFYIPPTGVEVIEDESRQGATPMEGVDSHVREAVTLERLEYCILVDENGDKRYERGPAVVFPTPTEHFVSKNRIRKFKAIELTSRSGLHIKVIHDYEDADGEYKAGDELFITGNQQAIYFPRIEHSIIRYGDRDQHFATAVPRGEGRYVMSRDTGDIKTEKGPAMLLPDPRTNVVVRRILSDKEVALWYPGNDEAIEYNRDLAATRDEANLESSAFAGAEDEIQDHAGLREGAVSESLYTTRSSRSRKRTAKTSSQSSSGMAAKGHHGDEFKRGDKFTPPRTVTLDTKYEGVAAISPFVGYAVLVVNKDGKRVVHQGPKTILLDYDETLEVLSISTGKPKNTDQLKRTVYLRIRNNKVSDIVDVETKDHVNVKVKISLLVNFEGEDSELWFQAENYVKLLCDHVRSVLKGAIQKMSIEDLYANHVAVVRDSILGMSSETEGKRSRPGMAFTENGMAVRDVEVLGFDIQDREVFELLNNAQLDAVRNKIELAQASTQLERQVRQEDINRKTADARAETILHGLGIRNRETAAMLEANIAKLKADTERAKEDKIAQTASEETNNITHEWEQKRQKDIHDQKNDIEVQRQKLFVAKLKAEVEAAVARFNAGKGGLSEALLALNRDDVMMKVAQATSVQSMIGGKSFVDVVQQIFEGTPLADLATKLAMHHPLDHHKEGDEG